ncbi:Zn(II)2Cys6 transcription factor [Aspergillus tubingensis]|uniref:Zn(II)2Cys6 transcription factor n=1 Tax=Aspergillus tubingensis TaxID=5068 RepID=UPI001579D5DC|nr:Zn(II)2Cys6 transcription factor [Aspergillus tubingensis]GFN20826.1 Zn(II)2Cys6 transcription factor [Aspergillus tubingensis]
MRIGRGCERCRVRHIRCTTRAGASACNACTRLGRVCRLDPPFRFKAVRHVYQKSNGIASKFELAWDPCQTWVNLPQSLKFVQESSDESDEGNTTDAQPDAHDNDNHQGASDEGQRDISDQISIFNHLPFPEVLYSHDENIRHPHVDSSPPVGSPVFNDPPIVASSAGLSPSLLNIVSPLASGSTWTSSASPLSSVSPRPSGSPPLSSREAHLLRLFIQKIAPWADICDLRSHFSTEVPRRALQVPMVLKAVLCLAARHDAIMSNASDWEASEYHGQCLELLISALALPEETYDDNLLITVVTLRIYEELERATDEKCHWVGSNRLLNTMSKSASSGGLAEAVSWQFLRQAIYASLVQHQPMQLDLANYELSSVFQRRDDASYANVIIFLCAKIIQSCWGSHCSFVDEGEWQHLSESVEQWHRGRPISWQPLQYKDSDPAENRPFPELWMMSPSAVVGLQYYHASCILLTSSHRHWNVSSDYELARLRRTEERTIASHLVRTIGLSMSNETVENAYFMACHLLHRYGYCLRHPSEKQGSLQFLRRVEKAVGWRTNWMIRELEAQWGELAEMDRWD